MAPHQRMVFFDIGNVLVDDDPFLCEAFRLIHQAIDPARPKAQAGRFFADLERVLKEFGHKAVERMGRRCHGNRWLKVRKAISEEIQRRWWELVHPIPGSLPVLRCLGKRFRLGIVANQPPQVLDFLEERGYLDLFEVVVIDSEHQVAKPDPMIFRFALEQARLDPAEGLMVGDRLDNDIIPARRIGMRAVLLWLHTDQKGWSPRDEWAERFREILRRLPSPRWEGIPLRERPLGVARRWEDLPEVLERVWEADI